MLGIVIAGKGDCQSWGNKGQYCGGLSAVIEQSIVTLAEDIMDVEIRISGVSEEVCNLLKNRAASEQQSLQDFLRCELERIAERQSNEEWLERVRKFRETHPIEVSSEEILRARDADRK